MYSRTENEDGSFNTRCLDCFMTIASGIGSIRELDRIEARHICLERVLSEMFKRELAREAHAGRN